MLNPQIPMLLISLISVDNINYEDCIYLHPCPNDDKNIQKLSKEEYKKTMECRIKRHIECLNRESESQ